MDILPIIVVGLLPAIVLFVYIYWRDKYQHEPIRWLLGGVGMGILSTILAIIWETIGGIIIDPLSELIGPFFGGITQAFFGAAIPEECCKLFCLWLLLRRNKYFDEHVDGIVYAACVGLGFAAIENLMYLFDNLDDWQSVGLVRAIFSVPGHFFFAVIMGYFYSLAHFSKQTSFKFLFAICALVVPVIVHGIYDSCLFVLECENIIITILSILVFLALCVGMNIAAFMHIRHLLKKDEAAQAEEQAAAQAATQAQAEAQAAPITNDAE